MTLRGCVDYPHLFVNPAPVACHKGCCSLAKVTQVSTWQGDRLGTIGTVLISLGGLSIK